MWCPNDERTEKKKKKTKEGLGKQERKKLDPYCPSLPHVVTINEFQVLLSSVTCLPSYPICAVLSRLVVSDSLGPHNCSLPGSSVHGDSPGKNTGLGCHFLLQGIFPTQGWSQVSYIAGRFFTIWHTRKGICLTLPLPGQLEDFKRETRRVPKG